MSKMVCLYCGNVFDEDELVSWEETHGLDVGPYEQWAGSPCCREAYVQAYICDECGEYINTETYVEIGDKKYCESCFVIKNLGD